MRRLHKTNDFSNKRTAFVRRLLIVSLTAALLVPAGIDLVSDLLSWDSATRAAAQSEEPGDLHILAASYYTLKGDIEATLTLNNKGPMPLDLRATLYSL